MLEFSALTLHALCRKYTLARSSPHRLIGEIAYAESIYAWCRVTAAVATPSSVAVPRSNFLFFFASIVSRLSDFTTLGFGVGGCHYESCAEVVDELHDRRMRCCWLAEGQDSSRQCTVSRSYKRLGRKRRSISRGFTFCCS